MKRRSFLASLLAVPLAGLKLPPKPGTWGAVVRSEVPFFKGVPLYDNHEYHFFLYKQMLLFVNNPCQSRILTGITGEGE